MSGKEAHGWLARKRRELAQASATKQERPRQLVFTPSAGPSASATPPPPSPSTPPVRPPCDGDPLRPVRESVTHRVAPPPAAASQETISVGARSTPPFFEESTSLADRMANMRKRSKDRGASTSAAAQKFATARPPPASTGITPSVDLTSYVGNQNSWKRFLQWLKDEGKFALIMGPPGVGKTHGVHLATSQYARRVTLLQGGEMYNPAKFEEDLYVSTTRRTLGAPSIVLVDDIDALLPECQKVLVKFVLRPPKNTCPLVCTSPRLLPQGLKPLANSISTFVLQRVETSEMVRHAITQARPGLTWMRLEDVRPETQTEDEERVARLLEVHGVRLGDRLCIHPGALGATPMHGINRVALRTREVFACCDPWRRLGRNALEAVAHRARGDLRQLKLGVTIPESGETDLTWTPLDASCYLLYGKLAIRDAEQTLSKFDTNFMANMLHANYVQAITNETITDIETVARASDDFSAVDTMRSGNIRSLTTEACLLLSRCTSLHGRKAHRPTTRVQWPDDRHKQVTNRSRPVLDAPRALVCAQVAAARREMASCAAREGRDRLGPADWHALLRLDPTIKRSDCENRFRAAVSHAHKKRKQSS